MQFSFLKSAAKIAQLGPGEGFEIAILGRSNVGKSTCLNKLAGKKQLARTSKTPGRTQLFNIFEYSEERRLIDMPGYGFAKVPIAVKRKWEQLNAEYLQQRKSLRGLILLMDIRHPLTDLDQDWIGYCAELKLPLCLLLNKADKISRGKGGQVRLQLLDRLRGQFPELEFNLHLFSAKTGQGLLDLQNQILRWWLLVDE